MKIGRKGRTQVETRGGEETIRRREDKKEKRDDGRARAKEGKERKVLCVSD